MDEYRPYLVSWNLTRKCNLLCPHCYLEASPSGHETPNLELTREEARFVIDELSYLNTRLMLVLSGGEPMLREDVFEIVEYASAAGFIPVLGSNGTLLTGENLTMFKEAGLKGLGISVDSTNSEYHDSFRGLSGAWEMALNALRVARKLGIETQMDVTLTDVNHSELDDFVKLGLSLSVKAINFFFLVCTGRAMKTDISGYGYEAALRKIALLAKTEKRVMVRARCSPHIYRILYEDGFPIPWGTRGCLAGINYLRIDPEGNVTPCPYMPETVGNIRQMSLTAIWNESPHLVSLREGRYKGRCAICEYTEICGGCRARALAIKGDFMEEDPICTYAPVGKEKVRLQGSLESELNWEDSARERIKNVPLFMRGMVTKMIEAGASQKGLSIVTSELIDELKKASVHLR